MKKVLVVTYYFPPSGGPGVQRVLKFVRYLREFGWQPVILTVQNADYPARDESLMTEIPDDVAVYRTRIFEPYSMYRRLTGKGAGTPVDVNTIPKPGEKRSLRERTAEWIRATFFIPDARIGWYRHAVREGIAIIREQGIDAIYSSSPPYTSAVIARKLKRATGLPWIAGFRDPWRGFLSAPRRWFLPDLIDRHFEKAVFSECDRMEVAWKGILKDFATKYPDIPLDKCHHLPNGFDRSDFPEIVPPRNDKFTVTYTGSMYGKRNPESFLKAVRAATEEGVVDAKRIVLQFIGRFGSEVHEMLDEERLKDAIRVFGYMSHRESVERLVRSDALLMIVDDFAGNEEIVPGKVFEYIGAGKPILAVAPEGAVAELIRETGTGMVASSDDIPGIRSIFVNYYDLWSRGGTLPAQNSEVIRKYDRREVTRRLASLLENVTPG